MTICEECLRRKAKIRAYRLKTKDERNARRRKRRFENREALLAERRAERAKNGVIKGEQQRKNYDERMRRYREKNRDKINARARAIRKIKRQNHTCLINNTNCSKTIHRHHEDYSKSLEVSFICARHHHAWHRVFAPVELVIQDSGEAI